MEYKNKIKLVVTQPIILIGILLKIILPIVAFIRIPYLFNSKGLEGNILNLSNNMIGAIIMFLLYALVSINLIKVVENYYPTQYCAADVNFLFTSPISSRLIYAWSIIKQIFNTLIGIIFIIVPLFLMSRAFSIEFNKGIIYAITGIILFIIIIQTLKFFIYSLVKRFNIKILFKIIIYVSFGLVAIYLLISIYNAKDILQGAINVFGGKIFENIPVIGWTKNLIFSLIINSMPLNNLILLIMSAAIILIISIYLATDYYEEAIVSTEKMQKIRKAFTENNIEEVHKLISKKKVKVKNVHLNWNLNNAYAFLWKAIVVNKRLSKGVLSQIVKYFAFAVIGTVLGYGLRNNSYLMIMVSIVIIGEVFQGANSTFREGLEYELKKNYIFLLPGRIRHKMLAINIIPAIKTLIRNFVLIFSMFLFLRVTMFQLISLWVVVCATNLMNLFITTVIKEIVPIEDKKNILLMYLRRVIEILLTLPALAVGFLIYYLFNNIIAASFIFGLCGLFIIIGLLYLSEVLFSRLELDN